MAIINGTSEDDDLQGTANSDEINGRGGNDTLSGLDGSDTLNGGAGDDVLAGGRGRDTLVGGGGNDTYIVLGSDTIVEGAGQGTDTAITTANFRLSENVENLVLMQGRRGWGNEGDNVLTGNIRDNILAGEGGNDTLIGGVGVDELTGGAGSDMFVLNAEASASNRDKIRDFAIGEDTIVLDSAVFAGLEAGELSADNFVSSRNGNAVDGDDYILYESDTGRLFYDVDGSGAEGKKLIAIVGRADPPLTADDFAVI